MENGFLVTESDEMVNIYGGGDKKKTIQDKGGNSYLLKLPSLAKYNNEASYSNNIFSEYICCHIFASIGFEVQETFLGIYEDESGKQKYACACKDFTTNDYDLVEFKKIKHSLSENENSNGSGTELEKILPIIDNYDKFNSKEVKNFFWNIFVVDSLIGNFDRHNGNWGFLRNKKTDELKISPVYDCGSCLFAQLTDKQMEKIIQIPEEMNLRTYIRPLSALTLKKEKINPYDFINSLENEDLNQAVIRVVPRINLNEINQIINDTPYISDIRKTFYQKILLKRYEEILLPAYENLYNRELDNFIEQNKIALSFLYDNVKEKDYFLKCYKNEGEYSLELIKQDIKNEKLTKFNKKGNDYILYKDNNKKIVINTKTNTIINGRAISKLLDNSPVE